MDHIPPFQSPVQPRIEVPYFLEFQPKCDGDFDDFPSRCSVQVEKLRQGNLHGCIMDNIIQFLQEWLFFGLLREILEPAGVAFRREDFIRVSDSGDFVSTTRLPRYIWCWAANMIRARDTLFGPSSWNEQRSRVARVLELSNACINGVIRSQIVNGGASSCVENVLLSIAVLGETLDVTRDTLIFPGREQFFGFLTWELPGASKRLLLEAGWCTGEIAALCRDFPDLSCLYYLSTWDRSNLGKNHSSCAERCLANQVDEKTYETKHADRDCDCAHLPNEKQQFIFEILDKGCIPVVSFSDGGKIRVQNSALDNIAGTTTTIPCAENTTTIPYVAISHVWSDGLGNAKSNTLPRCQLEYIQSLVNALYQDTPRNQHPIPFWIDTLCVPLEPAYRKKAIQLMSETYVNADKVLVLDRSLKTVSIHEAIYECMMRITTSPWATRLWTFQEGLLARELHFQFRDGTITPTSMQIRYEAEGKRRTAFSNFLRKDSASLLGELAALRLVRAVASGLHKPPDQLAAVHHFPVGQERQEQWISMASEYSGLPNYPDALFSTLPSKVYTSSISAFKKALGGSYLRDMERPLGPARIRWADCPGSTLYDLLPAVAIRTSSKPDDETLCVGGALGLDVGPLLSCREAERMKTLVCLLDTVPPDLIFAPYPKMRDVGYRWASKSFMNAIHETLPLVLRGICPPKPGYLQPKGLLVTLPGLKLRKATLPERSVMFAVGTGLDEYVRLNLELVDGARWSQYSGLDKLMIVRSNYTERAALTLLRENLNRTYFVEIQTLLNVQEYGGDAEPDVRVKVLDEDTRWCVD